MSLYVLILANMNLTNVPICGYNTYVTTYLTTYSRRCCHIENRGAFKRREAAEYIGVSLPVLDSFLNRKENPLPSLKCNRLILIPVNGLNKWLADEAERQHNGTAV